MKLARVAALVLISGALAKSASATVVLTGGGLTLVEQGGAFDFGNVASAANGATAFALDELNFGVHFIPNLNDDTYGNTNSWIGNGATGTSGPIAGINFGAPTNIQSFAFGRDNGGEATQFQDRWQGLYTLQYTSSANPNATTPDAAWTTIGTLNYQSPDIGNFSQPWLRHRYNFTPVSATGIRLIVPGTGLGPGTDIDEIEAYENAGAFVPPPPPPTAVVFTPSPGFGIGFNGNDGDFSTPANPALAPANLATRAGATAFGSSQLFDAGAGFDSHTIAHANDGQYGNGHSWLSNFINGDANPAIGIALAQPSLISSIAFGRDNGNIEIPPECCGDGILDDRWAGTYTIQVTTDSNPGMGSPWITVGTLEYLNELDDVAGGLFTPYLRHEFVLRENGAPILATGLRILVSDPNIAIDELEIYGSVVPEPSSLTLAALGLLGVAAGIRARRRRVS